MTVVSPANPAAGSSEDITEQSTRVVIATSDAVLCFALRPLLDAEGYEVSCVSADAMAVMARVRSFRPHLILVDAAEPGNWKQDILMQLREDPAHVFVAIVVLAAASDPRQVTRQALASGADDVIFKPCDRDLLVTRLIAARRAKSLLLQREGYLQHALKDLEQARAGEAYYKMLLAKAPDAVLVSDATGTLHYANDVACALLGFPLEELVGQPLDTLLPISGAQAEEGTAVMNKDGMQMTVDVRSSLVETGTEQVSLYVVRDRAARL